MKIQKRVIMSAASNDDDLGPLKRLPGKWANLPSLPGHGYNMIALPYAEDFASPLNYRLLVNQFNEELRFTLVDKGVPNRGIAPIGIAQQADQFLVALDYEQKIHQTAAEDFPPSGKAGPKDLPIHHEPGLWLYKINQTADGFDIARLATIPHGDSVLAIGRSHSINGSPTVHDVNGLPIGVPHLLSHRYLTPYKHFHENPFQSLFDPIAPNERLKAINRDVDIARTTILHVDTALGTGGIQNIPFIVRQADATDMTSTYWIQELRQRDEQGNRKLRLQYTQTVFLDFFPRQDGLPGRIRWPHVSINTLEKVA